jgi:hypothetical protein
VAGGRGEAEDEDTVSGEEDLEEEEVLDSMCRGKRTDGDWPPNSIFRALNDACVANEVFLNRVVPVVPADSQNE